MELTDRERERYSRQLMLPGFGPEAQVRLKKATALVAGVGGVGGNAALYLAAAGIGRLILLHDGALELPDLNRQILMSQDGLGKERVWQAVEAIRRINPSVAVTGLAAKVEEGRIDSLLAAADVALDCRHNFPERYRLNAACVRRGKPMVEAAMDAMEGYVTTIVPGRTPCLSCLFPAAPEWDHLGFGVLGAMAGTLGNLAALEVIKVITGYGEPLYSTLLIFDAASAEFFRVKFARKDDCPVCGALRPDGARVLEACKGVLPR